MKITKELQNLCTFRHTVHSTQQMSLPQTSIKRAAFEFLDWGFKVVPVNAAVLANFSCGKTLIMLCRKYQGYFRGPM